MSNLIQYHNLESLISHAASWPGQAYYVRVTSGIHYRDLNMGHTREYQIGAHVRILGPEGIYSCFLPLEQSWLFIRGGHPDQEADLARADAYQWAVDHVEGWADHVGWAVRQLIHDYEGDYLEDALMITYRDGLIHVQDPPQRWLAADIYDLRVDYTVKLSTKGLKAWED